MCLTCFSCCLEQLGPVKCSKNIVGSFKNMMYTKTAKINPRSVFWWISGVLWIRFLKILTLFCEKTASENGPEKWCPPRVKRRPIPGPGGSRTAPLACALFQTRNNNYSNNCRFSATIAEVVDTCQFFCRGRCSMSLSLQKFVFNRSFWKHGCCLVFCFIPTCVIRFQLQKQNSPKTNTQSAGDLTRPGPRPGDFFLILLLFPIVP